MQLYFVVGTIPDIDSQLDVYREFINYFEGGCQNDCFEGFELIQRAHLPGQGQVVALMKARGTEGKAEYIRRVTVLPWTFLMRIFLLF